MDSCAKQITQVQTSVDSAADAVGNVADEMEKIGNPGDVDYGYSYIKELIDEIKPKIDKYSR